MPGTTRTPSITASTHPVQKRTESGRGAPGERPSFADEAGGDYQLAESFSGVVNAAVLVQDSSLPVSLRGRTLYSFTPPLGSAPRGFSGAPDIGAYEFGVADTLPPAAPVNLDIAP